MVDDEETEKGKKIKARERNVQDIIKPYYTRRNDNSIQTRAGVQAVKQKCDKR